jgi:hypothetical protein
MSVSHQHQTGLPLCCTGLAGVILLQHLTALAHDARQLWGLTASESMLNSKRHGVRRVTVCDSSTNRLTGLVEGVGRVQGLTAFAGAVLSRAQRPTPRRLQLRPTWRPCASDAKGPCGAAEPATTKSLSSCTLAAADAASKCKCRVVPHSPSLAPHCRTGPTQGGPASHQSGRQAQPAAPTWAGRQPTINCVTTADCVLEQMLCREQRASVGRACGRDTVCVAR